jgi:hypothetical protein
MVIKRVEPVSCAKVMGTLYVIIGLVIGACFSLLALAGLAANRSGGSAIAAIVGVGAVVAFPIFYGVVGFLGTLLGAWLYNVAAGMVGGVEIEVQ